MKNFSNPTDKIAFNLKNKLSKKIQSNMDKNNEQYFPKVH